MFVILIILLNIILIFKDLSWGLGIGDWGLGPIPNPQSPIPKFNINLYLLSNNSIILKYSFTKYKYIVIIIKFNSHLIKMLNNFKNFYYLHSILITHSVSSFLSFLQKYFCFR